MFKNFIGIDNGASGAISLIREDGTVDMIDMPVIAGEYDINKLIEIFDKLDKADSFVVIERPITIPGQGAKSGLTVGIRFGTISTVIFLKGFSYEIIHPKKWQKEFCISGETKIMAFNIAKRLFPNYVNDMFRINRKKNEVILDGRVDALMMAEYGRRKYSK